MVPPRRQEWDRYMVCYDVVVARLWPYRQLINLVLDALAVKPGQRILDAGCGTGVLLKTVADLDFKVDLIGIDAQTSATERAEDKLGDAAHIVRENLNQPNWINGILESVDTMVSVNALYILEDPYQFLINVNKVLTPSGRLVLVNPYRMSWQPILNEHYGWIKQNPVEEDPEFEEALAEVIEFNRRIVEAAKSKTYHFLPPKELEQLCQSAGFNLEHTSTHVYSGTSAMIIATKDRPA